jgi:hypothetical protein
MHSRSIVALDQAEQVGDAALIDVYGVDVPEVVTEEDLYSIGIMTELGGDARSASGYLSDLLGLFLLELHLESCHVYHPINAVAPPDALSLSKGTHENVLCGYLRH